MWYQYVYILQFCHTFTNSLVSIDATWVYHIPVLGATPNGVLQRYSDAAAELYSPQGESDSG
jgi:hypothetical protein